MKKTLFYLLFATILFSCSKNDDDFKPDEPEITLEASYKENLAYGSNSLQKMDYYLPANRSATTTKVMILIHGGAWVSGDKSDFNSIVDSLRKRLPDWAFFNINYRLANITWEGTVLPKIENLFPKQEEDIQKAIEYIYDRRSSFVISDKWVYAGASAGAQLALLQGYKHTEKITPKVIINYFGPTDLNDMMTNPGNDVADLPMSILFNGTATQSSPVTFVKPQSAPTITFQGEADQTVLPRQQTILHNKLEANGVPNKLTFFPGEEHGFTEAKMTASFNLIMQFLNTHVK